MVAYIPELRLAFEPTSTNAGKATHEQKVKEFICTKQGIKVVHIPLGTRGSEERVAEAIKRGFRGKDIFISSDSAADVRAIRKRFFEWKQSGQNGEK